MVGGLQVAHLLYADDVVLMAANHDDAQKQLDALHKWCQRWWMSINVGTTQAMHIRNHQRPRYVEKLFCGEEEISFVDKYKYLGIFFHEFLSDKPTVEALTASASCSFGCIIYMLKKLQNMGVQTYETLYGSYVAPIMNYAAAIWGYRDFSEPQVLQNRILR